MLYSGISYFDLFYIEIDHYGSVVRRSIPSASVTIEARGAPVIGEGYRTLDALKHLGRGIENIDTRTSVCRRHKGVVGVVISNYILQIGLLANNIVREIYRMILGI